MSDTKSIEELTSQLTFVKAELKCRKAQVEALEREEKRLELVREELRKLKEYEEMVAFWRE